MPRIFLYCALLALSACLVSHSARSQGALAPVDVRAQTPLAVYLHHIPNPGPEPDIRAVLDAGVRVAQPSMAGGGQAHVIVTGPSWLVATVRLPPGAAGQGGWSIDLGPAVTGRLGFVGTAQVVTFADGGGADAWRGARLKGRGGRAYLPVQFEGEADVQTLALFLAPEVGAPLPLIVSPRLVPPAMVQSGQSDAWALLLLAVCAAAAGGVWALAALRRRASPALLGGYYATHASALALMVGAAAAPWALFVLAALASALLLGGTAFFWRGQSLGPLRGHHVFAGAIGVCLALAAIGMSVPGAPQTALFCAVLFVPSLTVLVLFPVFVGQSMLQAALYVTACTLPALGLLGALGTLSGAVPLMPQSWALSAYWVALVAQAAFLGAAFAHRDVMLHRRARLLRAQKARKAQALAQRKQEEEAKEQAHLLRVIERERELMGELRAREADRTEQMRQAKDAADEANRAKSAFLAVVSHEIRTPMTGILGMLRLLEGSSLNREQKDYVTTMRTSSDAMMRLLNDILDLEKIGSGQMDLEAVDFDLPKMIGSVVTLMSAHAAEKGLTLVEDVAQGVPRYVVGDPTRLRQVILNLVNNAVKFTSQGGVTISVRAVPGADPGTHAITFAVRDTGIGIPADVQERLFVPFAQAESSTARKYGGTGLGLAICKEIVGAMGAEIEIDSLEGRGTTFRFTLLMPEGRAESVQSESLMDEGAARLSASPSSPPLCVLAVEDNAINQRILRSLLEAHGHQVEAVDMAETALDLMKARPFDVILMDVNLAGMSGLEATRTLRAMPLGPNVDTPIIALTGNVAQRDIDACYAAGMNGFLPKPVRPAALYAMLKKAHTGALDAPVKPRAPQQDTWLLDGDGGLAPLEAEMGAIGPEQPDALWSQIATDMEMGEAPVEVQEAPPPTPAQETVSSDFVLSFEEDRETQGESGAGGAAGGGAPGSAPELDPEPDPEPPSEPKPEPKPETKPQPDREPEDSRESMDERRADAVAHLNTVMLRSLRDSVGVQQLADLMEGFWAKAQELVAALVAAGQAGDMSALGARGHELKGMAGNFGLAHVSTIAETIERAAKTGQKSQATRAAADLPAALQAGHAAFEDWMDS